MGDIEDLVASTSTMESSCEASIATARNPHGDDVDPFVGDSFLPGTKKIFIKTWGCAHNNSDSEYMAGQLAAAGYQITDSCDDADLWLLNSCTVKTPSEDQLRNYVTAAVGAKNMARKVPVVLAGCVPQAAPATSWMAGLSVVGVQQIDTIVEVVEETLKGHTVRHMKNKRQNGRRIGGAPLTLPKIRKNALIEILAINTGCLNTCTYCKTKQARGNLASYPIDEVVQRARSSFEEGVKEVWLTSEDLGAYGRDIGVTLPELLDELVKVIPSDCRMRMGMTNPPYILDHLPEIAACLNHPRVYAFLHIPVQSGSDAVLKDMKREYSCAQFRHVVDFMIEHVPNVHIATDFICAFPTETKEDYLESRAILEDYKFRSVFINQFYARPNTPAALLKKIDGPEAKRRTRDMSALFRSYSPYEGREGSTYDVLITEWATDNVHLVAHNKSYEQILIATDDASALMGKSVRVKIVSQTKFSMVGVIIDAEGEKGVDSDEEKEAHEWSGFKKGGFGEQDESFVGVQNENNYRVEVLGGGRHFSESKHTKAVEEEPPLLPISPKSISATQAIRQATQTQMSQASGGNQVFMPPPGAALSS